MEKLSLKINGMHCTSCEVLIKDSLEDTNAVKNIKISYKTGNLELEFDPGKTNKEKIKSIIRNEGYKV